jgi:4a-hydroxytetrahydrobiopterin dehydratase
MAQREARAFDSNVRRRVGGALARPMGRCMRHDGWRRRGDASVREIAFRDFDDALRFVERVAEAAVDFRRRPDLEISAYNHVRVVVANPNHAGFTAQEARLVRKVDALCESVGAPSTR